MLPPTTEQRADGKAFDTLSTAQAVRVFTLSQQAAISAVSRVAREIDAGADAMATAVRNGKSIIYAAAGSSGLMALADASELAGTFGIADDVIQIHMAGGVPANAQMPGNTEDETDAAGDIGRAITKGDVAIVLSASGTTPYAVAVARAVKENGGTIVGISNNPATELLDLADIAICLETPPEVIAGSTRLGGATAQKAALNLMSSLMGVKLGHVYQGLMVNVIADNAKLVQRAVGIIAQIADVPMPDARTALATANGDTKAAILVAAGCSNEEANDALTTHQGHLSNCFKSLKLNQDDYV